MLPTICDSLAASGMRAIRFDFSHNGVEAQPFDRPDLFLLDTFSKRQADLAALVADLDTDVGLIGHSRGGSDVLLHAHRNERVRCVATLAANATTEVVPPDAESALRQLGYYPIRHAGTGQVLPIARTALTDCRLHSVERAVRGLACPALFLHGSLDTTVPPSDLQRLREWCPHAEALLIDGADHSFGATHPFGMRTAALERCLERLSSFFSRHLGASATP